MTNDKRKGFFAGYKKLGPTGRFILQATIASIVLTVFGFFLGLFSSEYYYDRSQRDAIHLANITRSRPVPFVRKFPVIIEDGNNIQVMTKPGRYRPIYSPCPFSFFIAPDGSINLRGEIRDAIGVIVTEATGDSIRVTQASKYDINSDSRAIEVVDITKQPLFQLMLIPFEDFIKKIEQRRSIEEFKKMEIDEVIRLSYITQQGGIWLIASTHGIRSFRSLGENERSLISRLFCYPGYSYPGKRVDQ